MNGKFDFLELEDYTDTEFGDFDEFEDFEDYEDFEDPEDPEWGEIDYFDSGEFDDWQGEVSGVTFPSGESLPVVTGPDKKGEYYYDPWSSGNPLLDTSRIYRAKRLSKNFTVDELAKSGGNRFDRARIDPKLIQCLQAIRDYIGKPVTVTSGYRPYGYNINVYKKLGKKPTKSQHSSGRAADIKIKGMSGLNIAKAAIDAYGCNIGVGINTNSTHIDVRGRWAKWTYFKDSATNARVLQEIEQYRKERCKGTYSPSPSARTSSTGTGTSSFVNSGKVIVGNDVEKALAILGYDLKPKDGQNAVQRALHDFQIDKGISARNDKSLLKTQRELFGLVERLNNADRRPVAMRRLSRFRLTHYYVTNESDYANRPVIPVLTKTGKQIAMVNPNFFISMSIEGTGKLRDGRLINVTGSRISVLGKPEYDHLKETHSYNTLQKKGWLWKAGLRMQDEQIISVLTFHIVEKDKIGIGYGVQRGIPYQPFRTLAADIGRMKRSEPKYKGKGGLVPAKTHVFILELAGAKMPDGTIHDGWCLVNDTGGAIFGAHFDVFTGSKTLKKQVKLPNIGHIWFNKSEDRCPPSYKYGLHA